MDPSSWANYSRYSRLAAASGGVPTANQIANAGSAAAAAHINHHQFNHHQLNHHAAQSAATDQINSALHGLSAAAAAGHQHLGGQLNQINQMAYGPQSVAAAHHSWLLNNLSHASMSSMPHQGANMNVNMNVNMNMNMNMNMGAMNGADSFPFLHANPWTNDPNSIFGPSFQSAAKAAASYLHPNHSVASSNFFKNVKNINDDSLVTRANLASNLSHCASMPGMGANLSSNLGPGPPANPMAPDPTSASLFPSGLSSSSWARNHLVQANAANNAMCPTGPSAPFGVLPHEAIRNSSSSSKSCSGNTHSSSTSSNKHHSHSKSHSSSNSNSHSHSSVPQNDITNYGRSHQSASSQHSSHSNRASHSNHSQHHHHQNLQSHSTSSSNNSLQRLEKLQNGQQHDAYLSAIPGLNYPSISSAGQSISSNNAVSQQMQNPRLVSQSQYAGLSQQSHQHHGDSRRTKDGMSSVSSRAAKAAACNSRNASNTFMNSCSMMSNMSSQTAANFSPSPAHMMNQINSGHSTTTHPPSRCSSTASNPSSHALQTQSESSCSFGYTSPAPASLGTNLPQSPIFQQQQTQRPVSSQQPTSNISNASSSGLSDEFSYNQSYSQTMTGVNGPQSITSAYPTPPASANMGQSSNPMAQTQTQDNSSNHFSDISSQTESQMSSYASNFNTYPNSAKNSSNSAPSSINSSCMVAAAAAAGSSVVPGANSTGSSGFLNSDMHVTGTSSCMSGMGGMDASNKVSEGAMNDTLLMAHQASATEPTLNSVFESQDIDFPSISFPPADDPFDDQQNGGTSQQQQDGKKKKEKKKTKKKEKKAVANPSLGVSAHVTNSVMPNASSLPNFYQNYQQGQHPYHGQQFIGNSQTPLVGNGLNSQMSFNMEMPQTNNSLANQHQLSQNQQQSQQRLDSSNMQSLASTNIQSSSQLSSNLSHQHQTQPVDKTTSYQTIDELSFLNDTPPTMCSDPQTISAETARLATDCLSTSLNAANGLHKSSYAASPTSGPTAPPQGKPINSSSGYLRSFMSFIGDQDKAPTNQLPPVNLPPKEKKKRNKKEMDHSMINQKTDKKRPFEDDIARQNFALEPANKKQKKTWSKLIEHDDFDDKRKKEPYDEYEFTESPVNTSDKTKTKKRKAPQSENTKKPKTLSIGAASSTLKKANQPPMPSLIPTPINPSVCIPITTNTNANSKGSKQTSNINPIMTTDNSDCINKPSKPICDMNSAKNSSHIVSNELSKNEISSQNQPLLQHPFITNDSTKMPSDFLLSLNNLTPQNPSQNSPHQAFKPNQQEFGEDKKNKTTIKKEPSDIKDVKIQGTDLKEKKGKSALSQVRNTGSAQMASAGTNTPRRRSSDKKAATIREGLMRTGDFVVAIDDMHEELPLIWRIEGKSLLQRFEPQQQDNMTVYVNTSSYSAWNPTVKQRYTGVDVRVIGCSRTRIVVEKLGLTENNPNNMNGAPTIERVGGFNKSPQSSTWQHQENFEVFIQTLISQALDPNFISEIVKENDEYFLSHVQAIDEVCTRKKARFFSKIKWDALMVKCMDTYPQFTATAQSNVGDLRCKFCHDNWSTKILNFCGTPYESTSLELLTENIPEIRVTKYAACDTCMEKVNLYSNLQHQKYKFFAKCKAKVEEIRGGDESKESHVILEQCLQDSEWISKLFKELQDIWDACDKLR